MVLVDVECLSSKLTAANLNKRERSAKGAKEWSRDQDYLCRISRRAHTRSILKDLKFHLEYKDVFISRRNGSAS
jgi:hypothetical protein